MLEIGILPLEFLTFSTRKRQNNFANLGFSQYFPQFSPGIEWKRGKFEYLRYESD